MRCGSDDTSDQVSAAAPIAAAPISHGVARLTSGCADNTRSRSSGLAPGSTIGTDAAGVAAGAAGARIRSLIYHTPIRMMSW